MLIEKIKTGLVPGTTVITRTRTRTTRSMKIVRKIVQIKFMGIINILVTKVRIHAVGEKVGAMGMHGVGIMMGTIEEEGI